MFRSGYSDFARDSAALATSISASDLAAVASANRLSGPSCSAPLQAPCQSVGCYCTARGGRRETLLRLIFCGGAGAETLVYDQQAGAIVPYQVEMVDDIGEDLLFFHLLFDEPLEEYV